MEIDLGKFRGNKSTLFTGRKHGNLAREALNLDELDKNDVNVLLIIPEGTTSFNPSFFLGLLFDSIETLGIEGFKKKYKFEIKDNNPIVKEVLNLNIADAMRNASNVINRKIGFNRFLIKK